MERVGIIGAGHVGVSLLCDLTLRLPLGDDDLRLFHLTDGFEIPDPVLFHDLFADRTHALAGLQRRTSAFSREALEWLRGAGLIIVAVPDIPQVRRALMNRLSSHISLRDKVIVLCRGGQGGMPDLAIRIGTEGFCREANIVLIEDSFYGTRFAGNEVFCKRKYAVNLAIWSANRAATLRRLQAIFPGCSARSLPSWPSFHAKRAVELLFDPLGYIIHVAVAFHPRNLAKTKAGEVYLHYIDGIDEEIASDLAVLDAERIEIARRFGVQAESFPQIIARQYEKPLLSDFHAMMQSCRDIYKSTSNPSLAALVCSRYVHEDVPALLTMRRLAEIGGCVVPATMAHAERTEALLASLGVETTPLRGYLDRLAGPLAAADIVKLIDDPTHNLMLRAG